MQFKDPQAACALFIAKVEAVQKNNMELRIINNELIRLLEENGIDYLHAIKNIRFGFPSDGVMG